MKYQEIFLMNHTYVNYPNQRIPTRLCHRDEIAHPNKILDIVFSRNQKWRKTKINEYPLRYKRIEYNHCFMENISSSHFYVIGEDTGVFKDAKKVRENSVDDMITYLCKHQNTLFVITSPVFQFDGEQGINRLLFSIPVSTNQAPFITTGTNIRIRDLIEEQCYSICNGLTIFLAMVRSKKWNTQDALIAIYKWRKYYVDDNVEMSEIWQFLHTSHPIPMIADFPMYYATMNPIVPVTFYKYLHADGTIPLSQFVDDTNQENEKCYYASPITSMFPYLNRSIISYYNDKFSCDTLSFMINTPFSIEEEDYQYVDLEGLLISVLRSRRAWKWWKQNGVQYFKKLWELNSGSYTFFDYCLKVLFYLYSMPYKKIQYPYWRIRAIWNTMMDVYGICSIDISMFLTIHLVKTIVYTAFNITRINPPIPVSFMLDILKRYGSTIKFFDSHKYKLYTHHDRNIMINIFSPYITLVNNGTNEYSLHCSLYQLLSLDLYYKKHMVNHIIDKRISMKLLYIDKLFGLKIDKKNILNIMDDNDAYRVGIIMKEYIRENRSLLI